MGSVDHQGAVRYSAGSVDLFYDKLAFFYYFIFMDLMYLLVPLKRVWSEYLSVLGKESWPVYLSVLVKEEWPVYLPALEYEVWPEYLSVALKRGVA